MCNAVRVLLALQALALDETQIIGVITQTRGRREHLHIVRLSFRHPQRA